MFFKKDAIFICVKNTIFATSTKFYFMKKFLSLILLIILGFNVKAQTSLTEAVDFTGTDCYGEEVINLFEILDRGQHVLIDFYYYSCTPCERVVPYVVEAYEAFGCNNHDVFFMEVSHYDSDEICQWWAEKHGVQYPTISRQGGGIEIQKAYGPKQYPTLVLISPDRKILLQDMDYDSIKAREAQYIIEQLEQFGIEQHSCNEGFNEIESNEFNIYPNPASDKLYIETLTQTQTLTIEIYDIYGRVQNHRSSETQKLRNSIDVSELNSGVYFVKVKTENGEVVERFVKN